MVYSIGVAKTKKEHTVIFINEFKKMRHKLLIRYYMLISILVILEVHCYVHLLFWSHTFMQSPFMLFTVEYITKSENHFNNSDNSITLQHS